MKRIALLFPLLVARVALAQNAPVTIDVDASQSQHPIDPRVYGVAYGDAATLADLRCPLNRLGGNNTSRYNWQVNGDNRGSDWYFESIGYDSATPGEGGDTFISTSKAGGADAMVTIPMVGWVAKLGSSRSKLASFSIAKYGAQTGNDWQWFPDAGNGVLTSTGQDVSGNDPNDANVPADGVFQQAWMSHIVSTWGTASTGGLRYYILDNEHSIWHSTHRDVHPIGATMDEIKAKMVDYGSRVKAVDASAKVVGPEEWGWDGYFYSGYDQQYAAAHGWSSFPDRAAHGNEDYLPWLLDQLHQQEVSTGQRVLDVFSVHFYPQGGEFGNDVSSATELLRNRSTRALWDPSYVDESWINDTVDLIPRLKGWVSAHYPGLEIGITEYNWGADASINGATTQADILGIFGREGLDLATRWTAPDPSTPTYKAFKIYRNYDGSGGAFGDTSVEATAPQPDDVSAFAALRASDGALTVMVVSKVLSGTTPLTLNLASFEAGPTAHAFQLDSSNTITPLADVAVSGGALVATLPPQTVTLFVIPSAASAPPAFSVSGSSVTEPPSGTVSLPFTVTLVPPSTSSATVAFVTADGTAKAGTDYVAAAGTLTFAAGVGQELVNVTVLSGDRGTATKTLQLKLASASGAGISGATATGAIHDSPAPQSLQFSLASYAVSEAASAATIAVTRRAGATGVVTVPYEASAGTAVAGSDFKAVSGTLTFTAGVLTRAFQVPILSDPTREGDMTVVLSLGAPTGGAILGATSTAVLTIKDNDPPGVFSFAAPTYRVAETAGRATLLVRRLSGSSGAATVSYATADGTATAPGDYTSTSGTLTFPAGVVLRAITVPIVRDLTAEGDETLTVSLSSPTGGATLGSPAETILTIASTSPALQFSSPLFSVTEASAKAMVTLHRSGPLAGALQVSYLTSGGTATPGTDYTSVSGTLTFPPGVSIRTFAVPILQSHPPEGGVTVGLGLQNLVGNAALGTSEATLTILERPPVTDFVFGSAATSVAGGESALVTVKRTGALPAATVDYQSSDLTASSPADYTPASGTLSFPAGVAQRTFTVATSGGGAGVKAVGLALSNPSTGAGLGAQDTAALWIVGAP